MTYLGIDIGGSSVKVAALLDGKARWTGQSSRYQTPDANRVIEAIREAIGDPSRAGEVSAVGLCVPGLLDESRRYVTLAVNVPGLEGVLLTDLAAGALGRPVSRVAVANDTNAAGIDIYESLSLQGRLLALVIGTGVGASIIDDGALLHVDGDSPGHLGSIDVSLEPDPPIGPDGGQGSLEAYLGVPALVRQFGPDVNGTIDRLRIDDPPLRALVRAIRICHAVYRPQHVCLAGGIGIRMGKLVEQIHTAVNHQVTRVARNDWTLTVAESDYHAAFGVARLARLVG